MNIPLPDEQTQAPIGKTKSASAFLEVGRVMKEDILLYTGAGPTASILDVGCGWGRIARHFVGHVREPGRYVGMDVVEAFVDWCKENISPVNPAFSFLHQDVYNGLYNPDGKHEASEYRFPFEDGSFDVVFLTSVFTHMLPEDVENYLREIHRLLKPDGRCFSTWLLSGHDVDTESTGVQTLEGQVRYGFRTCLTMLDRADLTLAREPVLRRWAGDKDSPFRLQDLLLLKRSGATPGEAEGEKGSLLSRYRTPKAPRADALQTARGSVQFFDPVSNAVTLLVEGGVEPYRLAEGVSVRANGRKANSLALREGQRATVRFGEDLEGEEREGEREKIAVEITVEDRPTAESVAGTIENVDLERGHITLYSDREYPTFEFDPEHTRVRVNKNAAELAELKEGQRVVVRYVARAVSINSRDARPNDETGSASGQTEAADET